jgi:ribosome-binding protein aMBF1 (putative translation factor)
MQTAKGKEQKNVPLSLCDKIICKICGRKTKGKRQNSNGKIQTLNLCKSVISVGEKQKAKDKIQKAKGKHSICVNL